MFVRGGFTPQGTDDSSTRVVRQPRLSSPMTAGWRSAPGATLRHFVDPGGAASHSIARRQPALRSRCGPYSRARGWTIGLQKNHESLTGMSYAVGPRPSATFGRPAIAKPPSPSVHNRSAADEGDSAPALSRRRWRVRLGPRRARCRQEAFQDCRGPATTAGQHRHQVFLRAVSVRIGGGGNIALTLRRDLEQAVVVKTFTAGALIRKLGGDPWRSSSWTSLICNGFITTLHARTVELVVSPSAKKIGSNAKAPQTVRA